jgi:hypothetical protein
VALTAELRDFTLVAKIRQRGTIGEGLCGITKLSCSGSRPRSLF